MRPIAEDAREPVTVLDDERCLDPVSSANTAQQNSVVKLIF